MSSGNFLAAPTCEWLFACVTAGSYACEIPISLFAGKLLWLDSCPPVRSRREEAVTGFSLTHLAVCVAAVVMVTVML